VQREGLAVGGALALHPVDGFTVERVEGVHGALAPFFEHLAVEVGQTDGHPRGRVRVLVEPARHGWQGPVGT
jgi:hypothetical protein